MPLGHVLIVAEYDEFSKDNPNTPGKFHSSPFRSARTILKSASTNSTFITGSLLRMCLLPRGFRTYNCRQSPPALVNPCVRLSAPPVRPHYSKPLQRQHFHLLSTRRSFYSCEYNFTSSNCRSSLPLYSHPCIHPCPFRPSAPVIHSIHPCQEPPWHIHTPTQLCSPCIILCFLLLTHSLSVTPVPSSVCSTTPHDMSKQ